MIRPGKVGPMHIFSSYIYVYMTLELTPYIFLNGYFHILYAILCFLSFLHKGTILGT